MDIANLRAFASVAATGSFSGAAEQLHLTQPAVSKRVAILEDELGAQLFDRLGRRTELTEAGRALLERVPDVVYRMSVV
jgi:DNA-binding transcriptional LysR family regulator